MALTTTTKIRLVSDLTITDISDVDLASLITEAELVFWKDISNRVEYESPDGQINNDNREYRSQQYPIAPTGSTTIISTTDIKVYGVHCNNTTGFEETTELTVSTVYANDGRFRLSTAPDNATYDELRMHYSYFGYNTDWDKVSLAVAYATAFLAYGGKFTSGEYENIKFIDLSISQGSKSADNKSKADSMYSNYITTIRSLLSKRFRNKKIRPQPFIATELNASRRAAKFDKFHSETPSLSRR